MEERKEYKISKEGLILTMELLKAAGIEGEAQVLMQGNAIVIRPKGVTERIRGIIKGASLPEEKLEKFYHQYKGE